VDESESSMDDRGSVSRRLGQRNHKSPGRQTSSRSQQSSPEPHPIAGVQPFLMIAESREARAATAELPVLRREMPHKGLAPHQIATPLGWGRCDFVDLSASTWLMSAGQRRFCGAPSSLRRATPAPPARFARHILCSRHHTGVSHPPSAPAPGWRVRPGNAGRARRTAWCPHTERGQR
jgi:hypothetical protein